MCIIVMSTLLINLQPFGHKMQKLWPKNKSARMVCQKIVQVFLAFTLRNKFHYACNHSKSNTFILTKGLKFAPLKMNKLPFFCKHLQICNTMDAFRIRTNRQFGINIKLYFQRLVVLQWPFQKSRSCLFEVRFFHSKHVQVCHAVAQLKLDFTKASSVN